MVEPIRSSSLYRVRLRELRDSRGMSQTELSFSSGVNVHHISKIECGRRLPTVETCLRLCRALGSSLDDLIDQDTA